MGYTPHVLVVGIDPVGAAIARDFAIRGLDVTLIDGRPLNSPAIGRLDHYLASGAQYAREDPQFARRCRRELRIISEIADHCVEETGGLLLSADTDRRQEAARGCGITADTVSESDIETGELDIAAPATNLLAVPDATVDPYLLTVGLVRDAHEHDATIRPRAQVENITVEQGTVDSVTLATEMPWNEPSQEPPATASDQTERSTADSTSSGAPANSSTETGTDESSGGDSTVTDGGVMDIPGLSSHSDDLPDADRLHPDNTRQELAVDYVVNAAGPIAQPVLSKAQCSLPVSYDNRTIGVAKDPGLGRVLSCPDHSTLHTLSPIGGQIIIDTNGSGADAAPTDATNPIPSPEEVDDLIDGAGSLLERPESLNLFRAERTVRYTIDPGNGRDFAVIDHGDRDDCWGLMTVLGGSVTTHRWLAERVVDRVTSEFGINRACRTDEFQLPGSEDVPDLADAVGTFGLATSVYEQSKRRLGSMTSPVLHTERENPVLCSCRSVTRAEVRAAIDDVTTGPADLSGVRVRTAAGTGPCQGGCCAQQVATQLFPKYDTTVVDAALREFLDERWCGQRAIPARIDDMSRLYQLHIGEHSRHLAEADSIDIEQFDDGVEIDRTRPTDCQRRGCEP